MNYFNRYFFNSQNYSHINTSIPNHTSKRTIEINDKQKIQYCNNYIKTTKYTILTFLPLFLIEEFNPKTKIANCYFLIIVILQCIPIISNTNGVPTVLLPLSVVVIIDAFFQIMDDYNRYQSDLKANSMQYKVYNPDLCKFINIQSNEIKVGDIIKLYSQDIIPADILILRVSNEGTSSSNQCYVETKSLDGETNLKMKVTPNNRILQHFTYEVKGYIEMENPNKSIDSFDGVLHLHNHITQTIEKEPLQIANILLRGCVLRNTKRIIGIVINTGNDTKIMMATMNKKLVTKTSLLEIETSIEIRKIVILLVFFCILASSSQLIFISMNQIQESESVSVSRYPYLIYQVNSNPFVSWIIAFFYYFLLHATFIPVSLLVSMNVVRSYQSYFMNRDNDMYDMDFGIHALVRTLSLNEELGQISHIFSDKTGTLTSNSMDFRKMSIRGVKYGLGMTEISKSIEKINHNLSSSKSLTSLNIKDIPIDIPIERNITNHVSFYDPSYDQYRQENHNFFRCLSICHDIVAEVNHLTKSTKLSPSNPDDEALYYAAKYFGFEFLGRFIDSEERNMLVLKSSFHSKDVNIQILHTLAFTSKRKRMSVITLEDDEIVIYCKGADSVMFPRLDMNSSENSLELISLTQRHLNDYSSEGLRCLVITRRVIPKEEYLQWNESYQHALTSLDELVNTSSTSNATTTTSSIHEEETIIEALESKIESKFHLLGVTAIEDKLQEGVADTIDALLASGMCLWVLTGDKEETAINIAIACHIILPLDHMHHIILNKNTIKTSIQLKQLLVSELEMLNKKDKANQISIIIDGSCLLDILVDDPNIAIDKSLLTPPYLYDNMSIEMLFLILCFQCQAVICCRVSPFQKSQVVMKMKRMFPWIRTLAIGDGANDVAMIQQAHVGIGIYGHEGMQAVNNSDYAFGKFRFLRVLLLKHGRYNYIRMKNLICYMFYKNIFMSLCQYWFNLFNGFSGQKLFTELAIQLFNLIFTSLPIILMSIYDRDVSYKSIRKYPWLYQMNIPNPKQSQSKLGLVLVYWIIDSILDSCILGILPFYLLNSFMLESFWMVGCLVYTCVIVIVSMKMIYIQCQWHYIHILILLISIFSWGLVAYIININTNLDFLWYHVLNDSIKNTSFWLVLFLLIIIIFMKDIYILMLHRMFEPNDIDIVREIEYLHQMKDKDEDNDKDKDEIEVTSPFHENTSIV